MRLIIDVFKAIGVKIAEEIMLMNDYLRLENVAAHKLLKKHGITSREISDAMKLELSKRARDLNPVSRLAVVKIASPKTVAYKWFNKAKNKMYDSSDKRSDKKKAGRPRTDSQIREEIIQLATDNPSYSYRDIANKLTNANSKVSHETVRKILNEEGISPSPDRIKGMRWFDFMKTSGLWQMDCTTTHITIKNEVTNQYEIVCYHILLFINVATRKVVYGGVCESPDGTWIKNAVRSMLGFEFEDMKYLVMDRDPIFQPMRRLLTMTDIEPILLPPRSPNLNAYIERFHLSLKTECLSWLFLTSEKQLRHAVREYLLYYNHERPHQSLGGLPPEPDIRIIEARQGKRSGKLKTEERLNGLLKFHYKDAA